MKNILIIKGDIDKESIYYSKVLSRKFKSYVGLKNAESKLLKLLAEFEFTDIRTAVSTVNWENVKIVEL